MKCEISSVPRLNRSSLLSKIIVAAILLVGVFAANTRAVTSLRPGGSSATAPIETDGTLDASFNAGEFTNGQVNASLLLPDGKVLIGGLFSKVHGATRLGLARLNADGTLDSSFVPPPGNPLNAQQIVLQPDGKILVIARQSPTINFVRLNSDGSLDTGFNPSRTISLDGQTDGAGNATNPGVVNSALVQPDGKIVIVGRFFHIITGPGSSVPRSCVARLNSDGTLDASFDPKGGLISTFDSANSSSGDYVVRQNLGANAGKIIVEGNFDAYDFQNPNQRTNLRGLVRLNNNGSLDDTFNAGFGDGRLAPNVSGLFVQSDDRIIVFGSTSSSFGVISRLNSSGEQDPGFVAPGFGNYDGVPAVRAVAQQLNGKLMVAGSFHSIDGAVAHTVARLETNGARDNSFDSLGAGPHASNVNTVLVRPNDNKILVGGYFSSYGGAPRNNLAWTNADGSLDNTFNGLSGVKDSVPQVFALAVQPDGKILVGGLFSSFNSVPHYNLVRLNPDSTIDPSFDPNLGTTGSVRAILVQPDGKIVIAGFLTAVNGVPRGRIARLNADGTLDSSFDPGTGADSVIYALAQDSAGSIYAAGAFSTFNEAFHAGIVKLTSTGAIDPGFNPSGGGANSTVFAIAPPDSAGQIVIGGQFSRYNGVNARNVARLNTTTGIRDAGFNPSNIPYGLVRTVVAAPDGKYYVAGSGLARLNSNGTPDNTFAPPSTGGFLRNALVLQNDKLFVAGFPSPSFPALARLTSTGALDSTFSTGAGVEVNPTTTYLAGAAELNALAIQADGKLLFGGLFNKYNGVTRIGLARLTGPGDPAATSGAVANVSTRLPVGTGDNALIEGFIVQGPVGSSKKVIVRAIGPSLLPFGVADALANPTLTIHDASGATVATNNDWKATQTGGLVTGDQADELAASGLAPGEDLESAIIVNLSPGSYTAVVRGFGNTIGTGVVDAYDVSGGSPAKLANIATRGLIQPGDKLMIAGFIIQNAPVRAVLRAIGPSLGAFGITNALPDTTLQLRDQNGAIVRENDDWKTDPLQKQELEGNGLQPSHDLEAALIETIQPGQYTAQVRGKNEASGIGVVEVYFLD